LFLATCCSVFVVNWLGWQSSPGSLEGGYRALLFTTVLMCILLAHELAHFAVARRYEFLVGLPWFLPFPLMLGTLGAVIRLKESPKTRQGLLEMGAAGPLVGLAATAVVLVAWRASGPIPADPDALHLSTPALAHVVSLLLTLELSPEISSADPLGFAAWIGCLVTAMNLVPLGQLDGGHVVAGLAPNRAKWIGWGATVALLAAGLLWPGWAVWIAVLHLMGARHSVQVRDPHTVPSRRGKWVAVACGVAFLLCVTPVPVRMW
jgi:membrane-associated protease RseP (regulator of RpoE activity)